MASNLVIWGTVGRFHSRAISHQNETSKKGALAKVILPKPLSLFSLLLFRIRTLELV